MKVVHSIVCVVEEGGRIKIGIGVGDGWRVMRSEARVGFARIVIEQLNKRITGMEAVEGKGWYRRKCKGEVEGCDLEEG